MPSVRSLTAVLALVVVSGCAGGPEYTAPDPGVSFTKDPSTKPRYFAGEGQPTIDFTRGPHAIYPFDTAPDVFGVDKQNLAQTFTPAVSAVLDYLELPIACVTDVLFRLDIRSGDPSGPLLYSRTYDPAHAFADGTFLDITISPGVSLTAGTTYAFVLSSFPRSGASGNTCSILPGPLADSYAGGQGFYSNPGYLPYWIPLPNGALTDTEDLPFRTLVH